MSTTFEDYGLTVADVQSLASANLHSTILLAVCHAIHTCVFVAALFYIGSKLDKKRIVFVIIISFFWCANTVIVGVGWKLVDDVFIVHGASLESQFLSLAFGSVPGGLTTSILRSLCVFLADLILIWRCWVLYVGDWKIIVLPSLCLITETVSACILLASVGFANNYQVDWTLVYYSMTVATNSICTLLILFRIIRISGISASLKTYRGIFEILIESAVMYSVIYIALLVAYAYEFYGDETRIMQAYSYPQAMSVSITGIAPTLIIARVMAGKSRPDDSWTRPSQPRIVSIAESLRFAGAPHHSLQAEMTNDIDSEGRERLPV